MNSIQTVEELRKTLAKIPKPLLGNYSWDANRGHIRRELLTDDPAQFLKFATIKKTMFVGNAPYVELLLGQLMTSGQWQRWHDALIDPGFGNPPRYPGFRESSGNYIRLGFILHLFEKTTGVNLADLNFIVELGAGYGALPVILSRLGFKGTYIIVDLPEMCALQSFYLSNVDLQNVEVLHFTNPNLVKDHFDLYIALWSLSEIPQFARTAYEFQARHYLWAYQHKFDTWNNSLYFQRLARHIPVRWWRLPGITLSNHFLIGAS